MLKNKKIRQKYLFYRKGLNDFEAEWITCGCICTVRKKECKDYCDFVDIKYQKCISCSVTGWLSIYPSLPTQLDIHTSCPSTSQLLFYNVFFFGNSLSDLCLRHLQAFVVASNEQVQNIEKSKALTVEVVLCFDTVKARVQERQSDVHFKPS